MAPEAVEAIMNALPSKTATQGASTLLVAALDPKLKGMPRILFEGNYKYLTRR